MTVRKPDPRLRFDLHPDSPVLPWLVRLAPLALERTALHLHGGTGTGKERFARLFHALSSGAESPFVAVNCGAIPKGTLESELFGHRRGAFTGADRDHRGLLEQADGGTLFLDEIGEMPPEVQVRFLRVLQEREVRRLGEERVRPVRFALVSATHRPLRELAEEGAFREDLFHRVCAFTLEIPDLARRAVDLPRLSLALWRRDGANGRPFPLDARELASLGARRWGGNLRELANWLGERAWRRRWRLPEPADAPARGAAAAVEKTPDAREIRALSRSRLREEAARALVEAFGNKCAAARALGIGRSTLDYRLRAPASRLPEVPRA